MAKVVIFSKEIIYGFLIKNFMAGGKSVEEVEVWEDDVVTDFPYLAESSVESISGRISQVNIMANKAQKAKLSFAENTYVHSINVDCSESYRSEIKTIAADSILEYGASGSVDDLMVEPLVKVKLKCILSDKSTQEVVIKEGDVFFGMHVYPNRVKPVHGDLQVVRFVYKITNNKINITGFVLTDGTNEWEVPIALIKSWGMSGIAVSSDSNIEEVIAAMEADDKIGGVVLPNSTIISSPFTINNGKLVGPGIVKDNAVYEEEAFITAPITCGTNAEVTVRGVVIGDKSLTLVNDPKSITFEGCKFIGLNGEATKLYAIKGQGIETSSNGTELIVKNCYFGDNASNMYNFFELNTKIGKAVFANNYFTRAAANHNIINIYEVADDAVIDIVDNHFEYSANAIRVGTVGNPQNVVINLTNNVYDATDENEPEYAGLFFVQPYGTKTVSMSGITINCKGNKGPAGTQLYYIYCGSADTQLDDTTKPVINVL